LAAVKIRAIEVTKLLLRKTGVIKFAEPALTKDLYAVQKEQTSVTRYIFCMAT
jgi:hypothetical protein